MMNILADENIKEETVYALRTAGHDVAWVKEDSPGTVDPINLDRAVAEERLLITHDDDYDKLLFKDQMPGSCGVVLFVFSGEPTNEERGQMIAGVLSADVQWARMFRRIVFKFRVPPNLEGPI